MKLSVLGLSLPFLATISSIFAYPVHIQIPDPLKAFMGPKYFHFLKEVEKSVNEKYIPAMLSVIDHPEKALNNFVLEASFGKGFKAHLKTIRRNIETIKKYTATIGHTADRFPSDVQALYFPEKKKIYLFDTFFKFHEGRIPKTPKEWTELVKEAAPTLIHEISHGALGTTDTFWASSFQPLPNDKYCKLPTDCYQGYLHEQFKLIRNHNHEVQLHNAEAYLVFAHLAACGNVDITPRISKKQWSLLD